MTVNGWIVGFLISFSAMMLCCRKGDDDVVYKFFERKPTADEAKQRIRYVLAKFAAAISGAGLLVIFSVKFLIAELGLKLSPSQNKTAIIFLLSMVIVWAALGIVQNQIRRFQGRVPRPIFDLSIARFNMSLWIRPRK